MFGGGGQPSGEDILEATKITATAFMEHYNKTVESCYNKCILKYTGITHFSFLSKPLYVNVCHLYRLSILFYCLYTHKYRLIFLP